MLSSIAKKKLNEFKIDPAIFINYASFTNLFDINEK